MFDHKMIVMSDIHMVEAGERIIGLDPFTRFEAALAHALATHPDAKGLLMVGDLTHHGTVPEYTRLKAALAEITTPIHLMLGNHDRRDAFHQVFGGVGFVQDVIDLGDTRIIMLDTLDGPPYPAGHHAGRLCADRLDWLEAQLTAAQGLRVVLAFHHPPYDVGFPGMDRIKLQDADAFLDILERHGNVALMINGHVHRTISGQARGIPFVMFKSPCHQMPMLMAGKTSSSSVDEPGAYGLLCLSADDIVVHTEDFAIAASITPTDDGHST